MTAIANGVLITIPDRLLFEPGSVELQPEGRDIVYGMANPLAAVGNDIIIAGHTDPEPITQSTEYFSNWELSLERALTVKRSLKQFGYTGRIVAEGRAAGQLPESRPNENKDQFYARARRVDIIIQDTIE